MNDTHALAIVDTDRDELRRRIDDMRQRFYRLALSADPDARHSTSEWTVQQIVAHVVSIANRYESFAETGEFRRAKDPADLDRINREEMEALLAPVPDLVDRLKAIEPEMDELCDNLPDDFAAEFHFGVPVSGIVPQINWLFELMFHGEDIARAVGQPWAVRERDMLLALREAAEVLPAYVRPEDARPTTSASRCGSPAHAPM